MDGQEPQAEKDAKAHRGVADNPTRLLPARDHDLTGKGQVVWPSASRPIGSSSASGPLFPPQRRARPGSSKRLTFPKITDRAALPIRTERHVPDSLATLRRELAVGTRCRTCRNPRSMPMLRQTSLEAQTMAKRSVTQ